MDFDYPPAEVEAKIIAHESGVNFEAAASLAKLAEKVRNLKEHGLEEGVSTRLLIYAGQLMVQGVVPRRACEVAVAQAVTDDSDVGRGIVEVIRAIFP
jgi:nitric oxide reductase NorQ protein